MFKKDDEIIPRKIISASDWINLDSKELCNRILVYSEDEITDNTNFLNVICENIKPLKDADTQNCCSSVYCATNYMKMKIEWYCYCWWVILMHHEQYSWNFYRQVKYCF